MALLAWPRGGNATWYDAEAPDMSFVGLRGTRPVPIISPARRAGEGEPMNSLRAQLDPVRFGLVLGLLAVLYGWSLGILFGAGEEWLRRGFVADAERSRDLYVQKAGSEEGATAAIKRIDEVAFHYFVRAHMHGGGIGSIAIGASIVLALLSVSARLKALASTLLGLGSVGYPLFWMWAGLRAPALASSGAAKESLRWLAWSSSGALIVGAALTLALVVTDLFLRRGAPGRD
jgi:hypothetical protein